MDGKPSGGTSQLVRSIMRNRETKNVFVFVLTLGAYACIQALYGIFVDSLGLIADSFHNAFHCIGLTISLAGMIYADMQPSFAFSYGFDRHEVLAAFSNALFLIFLCLFVIAGAVHRYFEPSHIQPTARLLEFGLASLAINIAGVLTIGGTPGSGHSLDYAHKFSAAVGGPGTTAGSEALLSVLGLGSSSSAGGGGGGAGLPLPATAGGGGGARASNVRAVHITLVSHIMSSVAVILSSLAVRYGGAVWADTLQSVLVSLVTLTLAVPLFTSTGLMLLQAAPEALRPALDRARREASVLEGVTEVADEHFWSQSPGHVVGSLVVRTRPGADTQAILDRVRRAYGRVPVRDLTVQVEREPEFGDAGGGPASAWGAPSAGGHDDHHGHSHGGGHGHSHGGGHGHSHGGGGGGHGHSHGGGDHHGHSHGGASHGHSHHGHGEDDDHGHSHI